MNTYYKYFFLLYALVSAGFAVYHLLDFRKQMGKGYRAAAGNLWPLAVMVLFYVFAFTWPYAQYLQYQRLKALNNLKP